MNTGCLYRANDEYAAPRPSAGVFDSPGVQLCLNTEWASYLDGLLEGLLCPSHWQGTETEVEAAIEQVHLLMAKLADVQECQTEVRVHHIGEPFTKFTATAPAGALPMDGIARLQADYLALMAEIPASWKSGDYFTLPDMAGRGLVGQGFQYLNPFGLPLWADAGTAGGEIEHTLSINEMPAHTHQETARSGSTGSNSVVAGGGTGQTDAAQFTKTAGGGMAHNNMPPFLAAHWFIQAE